MTDQTVTLDAKTAAEIRAFIEKFPLHYTSEEEGDMLHWIAALTPREKTVPDGPFDEYFEGEHK